MACKRFVLIRTGRFYHSYKEGGFKGSGFECKFDSYSCFAMSVDCQLPF